MKTIPIITIAAAKSETHVQKVNGVGMVDDGYLWKKYGQSKMKGQLDPRWYFKCKDPECLAKK